MFQARLQKRRYAVVSSRVMLDYISNEIAVITAKWRDAVPDPAHALIGPRTAILGQRGDV